MLRLAELVCFGTFRPICWFRIKTTFVAYPNRRKIRYENIYIPVILILPIANQPIAPDNHLMAWARFEAE